MEDDKSKHTTVNVSEISFEDVDSLPPRPHVKRTTSARAVIQTDDWWLWELAGILIALAALAGIGALLSVLNDRPQPSWAYTTPAKKVGRMTVPAVTVAISPNTILSLLSTIGRICIMIPVTKGLAQLKWVWFAERERQLSDFEVFDNAKSVTGSLALVWKFKFRHFAVVGATAVLLALAFDPFVQNLLSYHSKNVEDSTIPAQLPRATKYVGGSPFNTLNAEMKAAIIAGFSAAPNFDVPNYYCASGNCTWESTPTLGVCSRCADVSSMLARQCNGTNGTTSGPTQACRFSLPNGFHLNAHPDKSANMVVNSTINSKEGNGFQPLVFANYTFPIARIWSIFGDSNDLDQYTTWIKPQTKVYATECALVPCVQVYNSALGTSVDSLGSGVTTSFNDRVVAEYDTYQHTKKSFSPLDPPDNSTGSWLEPSGDEYGNEAYHLSAGSQEQLAQYLQITTPGTVSPSIDVSGGGPYYTLPGPYNVMFSQSLFLQNVFSADPATTCNKEHHTNNWEPLRFQCAIENMAKSMTVNMRNTASALILGPGASTADGFQKTPLIALGSTMVAKTYINVTWYWLALPIVLWFLAVIMFVGTVWKTRKAGVRTWRTSTLAPLFLGLGIGDEQKQKLESLPNTADGLQKKAEEIKVQLHLTEQEAKFVGG